MPKFEPKAIQKELEAGTLWPVYWLYGQEAMMSREVLKRIRKAVLGDGDSSTSLSFNEEVIDNQNGNAEFNVSRVLDAAQSLSLGGGTRLIIVRDAHALKDADRLAELFGPSGKKSEMTSVCVFLSKDLDGRKKFSKALIDKAAVVPCEEIADQDRDAWIGYLAKKKGVEISDELAAQLRFLDPWSLDIIESELEKYSLAALGSGGVSDQNLVVQGGVGPNLGGDSFLDAFFGRRLKDSLLAVESFADFPDESLPLLGLLAWNARFLGLVVNDHIHKTRETKISPFLADRFNRWSRQWSLGEVVELQSALAELDFGIKQTQLLSLALWTELVTRFCSA